MKSLAVLTLFVRTTVVVVVVVVVVSSQCSVPLRNDGRIDCRNALRLGRKCLVNSLWR